MPRIRLTKSAIDALSTPTTDAVYWDVALPGFGLKVTPKGHKVFIVLYRTGGGGSKLRKYTIGPYGRITLHQARIAAQKVFAAKLEGRETPAPRRAYQPRLRGRPCSRRYALSLDLQSRAIVRGPVQSAVSANRRQCHARSLRAPQASALPELSGVALERFLH